MKQIKLDGGGKAVLFPGGLVVFNFSADDTGTLSQLVSAAPGKPVVFLSTEFHKEMFSQAEGHNRTYVLNANCIDRQEVDPVYPAMWLNPGDMLPDVPGNVQVTATDRGFRVDTLPPDPRHTATFS